MTAASNAWRKRRVSTDEGRQLLRKARPIVKGHAYRLPTDDRGRCRRLEVIET